MATLLDEEHLTKVSQIQTGWSAAYHSLSVKYSKQLKKTMKNDRRVSRPQPQLCIPLPLENKEEEKLRLDQKRSYQHSDTSSPSEST